MSSYQFRNGRFCTLTTDRRADYSRWYETCNVRKKTVHNTTTETNTQTGYIDHHSYLEIWYSHTIKRDEKTVYVRSFGECSSRFRRRCHFVTFRNYRIDRNWIARYGKRSRGFQRICIRLGDVGRSMFVVHRWILGWVSRTSPFSYIENQSAKKGKYLLRVKSMRTKDGIYV